MPDLTSTKGHKTSMNELTENLAQSGSAALPGVALNSPPSCLSLSLGCDSYHTRLTMNSLRAIQYHQLPIPTLFCRAW